MTVEEVSRLLGTTAQTVRVGLQQGVFPFGVAFKVKPGSKNFKYIIYPEKVREYITGAR